MRKVVTSRNVFCGYGQKKEGKEDALSEQQVFSECRLTLKYPNLKIKIKKYHWDLSFLLIFHFLNCQDQFVQV